MRAIVFIFVTFCIPTVCAADGLSDDISSLVQQTHKKFAPDKRVAVFDVNVKNVNGEWVLNGVTSLGEAKDELVRDVQKIAPGVVDQIEVLPSSKLGDKTYGVINVSVANLRYAPNYAAELGLQGMLGMPVRVLQYDRWYRVQMPSRYICYTTGSSIVRMNAAEFNDWTNAPKLVFVEHYGFAYEKPDVKSQTVSDLCSGCMLKLELRQLENSSFYAVSYPDGRKAFVLKSQSMPFDEWERQIELTAESVLAKAKTLMGVPYLWAGTSAKGVDCSGLTSVVFFLHGVIIPRDASQQVHIGLPVEITPDYKNLQPGDLLFFGKCHEDGSIRSVRHVAFYLGDGEFIHAAGCVKINSLLPDRPDYDEGNTKELICVKRILGQVGTPGIEKIRDNPMYQPVP